MTPFMSSLKRVKHIGISTVTDVPVLIPNNQLLFTCEEKNVPNFEFRKIGTVDYLFLRLQLETVSTYISSTYFALYVRVHLFFPRNYVLTLRLLMSYIYGAPILDVSRSHTTTHHSR